MLMTAVVQINRHANLNTRLLSLLALYLSINLILKTKFFRRKFLRKSIKFASRKFYINCKKKDKPFALHIQNEDVFIGRS